MYERTLKSRKEIDRMLHLFDELNALWVKSTDKQTLACMPQDPRLANVYQSQIDLVRRIPILCLSITDQE
jgi:hypothetical protein